MPDRVGQQIGKYRLVRLLGKGGFAEVYLGQHVRLVSKQAAIKILLVIDVDGKKFQEEAETTERLVHPHIVRLLDFDIEDDTPFLVLDYAPGGSLRARHPKGSSVPLDTVRGYLKEIAPALQYAHDLHILHRDIKPDNMLIGRQGELLVSDFGIAVLTQTGRASLSSAYTVKGTPYYMAPETYRGKPVKESDQYALAIMVYEWLCGSRPFEGSATEVMVQQLSMPPPPLQEKNPAISPNVEAVVMTALSKDPQKRFGSVSAFANAFEQACLPSRQALPRVESISSQSTLPWMTTNQSTPQREAVAQQFEQRAAPVQPVSQKNSSIPPPPPAPSTNPYPPHYLYAPQMNPYPYPPQMDPIARPMPLGPERYVQPHAAKAKHKRNKRVFLVGGIGSGAAIGGVEIGIFAAEVAAFGGGAIERLIVGAILGALTGAVLGAVASAISLAVIRILAGKEALAFSGGKEAVIVIIAGIVAGAATPFRGSFAIYAQFAVAVVAGVVAGAVVAGIVRKKSSFSSKSS